MDGTSTTNKICILVEARGVPFGLCTRQHMTLLVQRFGTLRKIIFYGLFDDNPHVTMLEVEVQNISAVPPSIRWCAVPGALVIRMLRFHHRCHVVVAWNESLFAKVNQFVEQHVVAV